MHVVPETEALWMQYNDLMFPVFTAGISRWMDNRARAAGVLQQAPGRSGNNGIIAVPKKQESRMKQTGVISGSDGSRMKSTGLPVNAGIAPDCNELHLTCSSSINACEWHNSRGK